MFLNLPRRLFIEKEVDRIALQQNDHDWGWYFWTSTNDTGIEIDWTGNNIANTNYIILGFTDRTNRTVDFNVKITHDSGGTTTLYDYNQSTELLFEENLTWVGTYYPSPKHFRLDDDTNRKVILHKLTASDPSWDVDRTEWRGFQCIGTRIWDHASIIEVPIDNFVPDTITTWDYAIVYGHWLDHNTNLLIRTANEGIKPISWTYSNREFVIVMKPNESLLYSCYNDGYGRGFGITYIQFYQV